MALIVTLIYIAKCSFQQPVACSLQNFSIFCPSGPTMVRIWVKLKVVKFYRYFSRRNFEKLIGTLQKDLDVCFVQWGIKFTEVWHTQSRSNTFDITHKKTKTHTAHSRASRLTGPYQYIFKPTAICSQQLPLLQ